MNRILRLLPRLNTDYYKRQLARMSAETLAVLGSEIEKAIETAKKEGGK